MNLPKNVQDLQRYISNQVQENLHLDYKGSESLNPKKRHEIAKDVSAFANSDGGMIIYGLREENHLPVKIDNGADHEQFSKEWLEQGINSNVSPKIDGLTIVAIPLSDTHSAYAVGIPKSYRGPHQERESKRYYRRYNFQSAPMEDYEINDIRNRRIGVPPGVDFDIEIKHGVLISLVISNIGKSVAQNVAFRFTPELPWGGKEPRALKDGIKSFPPGRVFRFYYHTFQEVFAENSKIPREFDVQVEYDHTLVSQRLSESFHFNLSDYMGSAVIESELNEVGKKIESELKNVSRQVAALTKQTEELLTIAGPTGLHLSIRTLRNLKLLSSGSEQLEPLNPQLCEHTVFEEVLGVERDLALRLREYFRFPGQKTKLTEIEGLSPKVLKNLKQHFRVNEPDRSD